MPLETGLGMKAGFVLLLACSACGVRQAAEHKASDRASSQQPGTDGTDDGHGDGESSATDTSTNTDKDVGGGSDVASCSIEAQPSMVAPGGSVTLVMTVQGPAASATLQGRPAQMPTMTMRFEPGETTEVAGSVIGADGGQSQCKATVTVSLTNSVCSGTSKKLTNLVYADVAPIFAGQCASCHSSTGGSGGGAPGVVPTNLSTYASVKAAASSIDSLIYASIDPDGPQMTGMMPPSTPLCADDYAQLKAWIAAGAPE
jgi:hypothetical protein